MGYVNDMKVPVTKVKMTEVASEVAGTQLLDRRHCINALPNELAVEIVISDNRTSVRHKDLARSRTSKSALQ